MKRQEFIIVLATLMVALPLPVRAQQPRTLIVRSRRRQSPEFGSQTEARRGSSPARFFVGP